MKKPIFWMLLAIFSSSAFALELAPLPQQSQAALLTTELLSRLHYKAIKLDDAFSVQIFDHYLKSLDAEKYFLKQADIDALQPLRTRLDDAIKSENLVPVFGIFNLYAQRVVERYTYAKGLLKEGFDFSQDESLMLSREKEQWPKSDEEINELWRKRVKNDWLRLKLAGKDDQGIHETLDKRYEAAIRRIGRLKSEDVFQGFMNAYTTAIDPHTNYLGPQATENFDISMRLSLVGIGAVLQEKDEYTTIREVMAGSPAAKSGQLKVGDRIVGVGQGENAPLIDVTGWRLDDTVKLIRGESDSTVVLDILPADAGVAEKHKLIPIVRKKISLDEQAAKQSVISVSDGGISRKIGVISLPSFYEDFDARQKGEPNYKSATRDVEKILIGLKKQKVDSILIDLRGNGGGSLVEAIELTGLFIDKGPVVQQRDAHGKINVENDTKAGVDWEGPIGVLINRESASASEIFAAAIQDYGRGLIIGEPSFGKGTVQTMLDLDRITNRDKPVYGELKMTVAQFFRINGGTTQLRGVTPDIGFPVEDDTKNWGESGFDNALPWVQIGPANYSPVGNLQDELPGLRSRHESRLRTRPEFQNMKEDLAEINRLHKTNIISLNEVERLRERSLQEKRAATREASKILPRNLQKQEISSLRDDGLQADERSLLIEIAAAKERKDAKDPLLEEAAHILSDELGQLNKTQRLVAGGNGKTGKSIQSSE